MLDSQTVDSRFSIMLSNSPTVRNDVSKNYRVILINPLPRRDTIPTINSVYKENE